MDPTDYDITDAMIAYGGSFVSALGQLYRKADGPNRERIKATFPDYFREYREMAELRAQRQSRGD